MPKYFDVEVREIVLATYRVIGNEDDTPETIKHSINKGDITLDDEMWADSKDFTVLNVEEIKGV